MTKDKTLIEKTKEILEGNNCDTSELMISPQLKDILYADNKIQLMGLKAFFRMAFTLHGEKIKKFTETIAIVNAPANENEWLTSFNINIVPIIVEHNILSKEQLKN